MNPYKILNVSPDVSPEELKKAFYELAKLYHPDKARDEAERVEKEKRFSEITWAYNAIKASVVHNNGEHHGEASTGRDSDGEEAYVRYLYGKAKEFLDGGDVTSAISTLYVLKNMKVGDEKAEYLLGVAHLKKGDYHRALSCFKEVVGKNPWNVNALLKMANIYEKVGLKKTALSVYNDVLRIDSSNRIASERVMELERQSSSIVERIKGLFQGKG